MDKNWIREQCEWLKAQVNSYSQQARDTYTNTKQEVCKQVEPTYTQIVTEKEHFVNEYEKIMNPNTRKERDLLVFVPTFIIGAGTFYFIRRPRTILRNTVFSYLVLSVLFCKENFNPLK